ncbi:hypothetical protein CBR59_28205 [Bacillus thuringiensis]|uniref:hypothetical protein n=1 Tax=Bacillus thuringiensis TaxID=1428 RepID=UPI000C9E5A98|nr:hypothetical protein [Bacillus thuringiensis]MDA2275493.1 hypothetical protein [Bacillus cereus]PNK23400.1 hypothetical protein CBP87_28670 [Bacillus thuringiensis]PNK48243.1 hypothetical protein CBR59_28205 [Bacillus thuringiensis]
MTLITLNLLLVIILCIIFVGLVYQFGRSMFFDISIIYAFVILLAPFIFFIANLIYVIFFSKTNVTLMTFIPLLLPLSYFISSIIKKHNRKKRYIKAKELIVQSLIHLAFRNDLIINEKDVRIRVKDKNKIDFIINTFNKSDKDLLKNLLDKHEEELKSQLTNQQIRFLIDEKKSKKNITNDKVYNHVLQKNF